MQVADDQEDSIGPFGLVAPVLPEIWTPTVFRWSMVKVQPHGGSGAPFFQMIR
jgi:hypothetical protein